MILIDSCQDELTPSDPIESVCQYQGVRCYPSSLRPGQYLQPSLAPVNFLLPVPLIKRLAPISGCGRDLTYSAWRQPDSLRMYWTHVHEETGNQIGNWNCQPHGTPNPKNRFLVLFKNRKLDAKKKKRKPQRTSDLKLSIIRTSSSGRLGY